MATSDNRMATMAVAGLAVVVLAIYAESLFTWAFVGDDAYISFRYARNLVDGHGLRWNPGDTPVEGYTNLGWVMVSALGLLLGIAPPVTTTVVGITCGLAVLFMVARLAANRWGWHDVTVLAAPLLLVCTRSFAAWSTSGLETMAYTALLLAGFLQAETERSEEQAMPWRSSLLLTGAVWMRPDGLLFAVCIGAFHFLDALRGVRSWRSLGWWLAPAFVLLGGHEILRIAYYGDWVPNTFRVKVNGSHAEQGLRYLHYAHLTYGVGFWAWFAMLPALWRRTRMEVVFTVAVLLHLAYVVYVGGDRFELRFLVPVMPMVLWLWVDAWQLLGGKLGKARIPLVMVATLALGIGLRVGSQQKMGPIKFQIEQIPFIKTFAEARAERGQLLRAHIDAGRLPDDIRLCVGAAGALPYYADLWALDYFGLNDREIARQAPAEGGPLIVAHEKRASVDRIVAERVDMFDGSGLLVTQSLDRAAHAWEKSKRKLRRMKADDRLTLVCHRVEDDWLVFITTLSEAAHDARYGHLDRCDDTLEAREGR